MGSKKYDEFGRVCSGLSGKTCEYKPWSEFNKCKSNASGYDNLCRACTKEKRQSATYKRNNKKRMAESYATEEGKQAQLERNKRYRESDKGKVSLGTYKDTGKLREVKKRYNASDKGKEALKRSQDKYRELHPITCKMRNAIKNFLINYSNSSRKDIILEKYSRNFEKILGYTGTDIVKHLESRWTEGMNWANYGTWSIDHIKAITHFKGSEDIHSDDFKECWALDNIQPLWLIDNQTKGIS